MTSPAGAGPGAAKGLIASTGVQAISNENRTLSHIDLAQDMEGSAEANQPHGFVAGSDVVGLVSAPAAQSIAAAVSAWPRAAGLGQVIIKPLDGAVAGLDTGATAFPWRRQAAVVQWYVYGVSTTASRWISTAHAAVQPHSVGGYVNYLEPGTTAARYFAGNLAGLQGSGRSTTRRG